MQQEPLLCSAEVLPGRAGVALWLGPRAKRANRKRKRFWGNGRTWPVAKGSLHPSLKRAS